MKHELHESVPANAGSSDGGAQPELTPRQKQILELLKAGKVNKEIAKELGIGLGTVKQHMVVLFKKLRASNRTMAVSHGLSRESTVHSASLPPQFDEGILARRPCIVFSIVAPDAVPPDALEKLLQSLAAFASANDALLLTRKDNSAELMFGIHSCTEYDIYKAYHAGRAVFLAMKNYPGVGRALRGGLSAGMAIVSMKRHGGWTGEVVTSPIFAQALNIAHSTVPGTVKVDKSALELLQVFGPGCVDATASVLPFAALQRMPWTSGQCRQPPLVGREQEIARLHALMAEVRQGRNRLVYLEGETGMGKSRICRHLAEHHIKQGGRVYHFVCQPKSLTGVLYRFPSGLPAEADELVQCLEAEPIDLPDVVIVDDSHLLSAEILIKLTRQGAVANNKLVLIAGRRFPQGVALANEVFKLGRLSGEALEALSTHLIGETEPRLIDGITRRASGVPLFAIVLAQQYRNKTMPFALRVVIAARMDGLRLDHTVLAHLAQSPESCTVQEIADALHEPLQTVQLAVEQAIESGVLQENAQSRLSFTHPLLQQAVAESRVE